MRTTVLECMPWLADKLTKEELDELDDYVVDSIDEAIDSIDWIDVEQKFYYKISSVIDTAIKKYAEIVKDHLVGDAWNYHNDHGHIGSFEMCKDDTCVTVHNWQNAIDKM